MSYPMMLNMPRRTRMPQVNRMGNSILHDSVLSDLRKFPFSYLFSRGGWLAPPDPRSKNTLSENQVGRYSLRAHVTASLDTASTSRPCRTCSVSSFSARANSTIPQPESAHRFLSRRELSAVNLTGPPGTDRHTYLPGCMSMFISTDHMEVLHIPSTGQEPFTHL